MIVIVDDRKLVTDGYSTLFAREGVATTGLLPSDFSEWISTAPEHEVNSIQAILLGKCENQIKFPQEIRTYSSAPILAMTETNVLDHTIELFQTGIDDVLHKPIHVREILARIAAIHRRIGGDIRSTNTAIEIGPISIFNDGRDPRINGTDFPLPRREKHILEYLATNYGKRVNKTQIFKAIYGIFDDVIEENVVESHISKLRKKLKLKIGYDVINSKRFLGYSLIVKN